MNPIFYYTGLAIFLLVTELLYFRVAARFNIIDKPNQRSSHINPTIRGGGIIFLVAIIVWFVCCGLQWPWMMISAAAVAGISFLDDLKPRPALIRFLIHLFAVGLLFCQVGIYDWPWVLVVLAWVICIGTLSAFNFMDGINGITGLYGLVSLGTFLWIQQYLAPFSDPILIGSIIISVLVFLFFNFRKQAKCFAGDVGSVSIAIILVFLLPQ